MPVVSPVSERTTVACLLLLTFATGIVDAISVLVLGHVFVANMTGNIIFLGFWFAPHTVVDMTAALVALVSFVAGAVFGGRLARHLDDDVRRWLTVALGFEVLMLVTLSILTGTGVIDYHDNTKLILVAGSGLDVRQPGRGRAPVRHTGAVHHSADDDDRRHRLDSRLAGGTGQREKLRYSVVLTMCAGALVGADLDPVGCCAGDRARRGRGGRQRRGLPVRPAQRRGSRGLVSAMPSVLVTGAGRGIGKSIVEHLAAHGWDVIAGIRNERDAASGYRAESAAHLLGHPRRHRCRTHRRPRRVAAAAAGRDRQQRGRCGERADGDRHP